MKAVLGELPYQRGTISVVSKSFAYSAQTSWLLNLSIRQIICGPIEDTPIDENWYRTVLHACALGEDLQLPDGDESVIGSRGAGTQWRTEAAGSAGAGSLCEARHRTARISQQGAYEELKATEGYIKDLSIHPSHNTQTIEDQEIASKTTIRKPPAAANLDLFQKQATSTSTSTIFSMLVG
jgi:hypothetical protein